MAAIWLKTNGASCSLEKLVNINNNRANWLGTADSIKLMSLVDGAIKLNMDAQPELLAQLNNANKNALATAAETQPAKPEELKPVAAAVKAAKPGTP